MSERSSLSSFCFKQNRHLRALTCGAKNFVNQHENMKTFQRWTECQAAKGIGTLSRTSEWMCDPKKIAFVGLESVESGTAACQVGSTGYKHSSCSTWYTKLHMKDIWEGEEKLDCQTHVFLFLCFFSDYYMASKKFYGLTCISGPTLLLVQSKWLLSLQKKLLEQNVSQNDFNTNRSVNN